MLFPCEVLVTILHEAAKLVLSLVHRLLVPLKSSFMFCAGTAVGATDFLLVNLNVVLVQFFLVRELLTCLTAQANKFDACSFLVLRQFRLASSCEVTLFAGKHLDQFFNLHLFDMSGVHMGGEVALRRLERTGATLN